MWTNGRLRAYCICDLGRWGRNPGQGQRLGGDAHISLGAAPFAMDVASFINRVYLLMDSKYGQ